MQFDHVEAPESAGPPACAQCRRPLDEYFALGGHMFCRTCIDGYKNAGPFWRALLLFGAGGVLVGAISPEYLFLFGRTLVMPFVGETSFIGCIIVAIALYEAWKLNRRVPIEGPFRFGGSLSVPAPTPVMPAAGL